MTKKEELKNCLYCGEAFKTPYHQKKYCSKLCWDRKYINYIGNVEKECVYCSKKFMQNVGNQISCSRVCYERYYANKIAKPSFIVPCCNCGKDIKTRRKTTKFCSKTCRKTKSSIQYNKFGRFPKKYQTLHQANQILKKLTKEIK